MRIEEWEGKGKGREETTYAEPPAALLKYEHMSWLKQFWVLERVELVSFIVFVGRCVVEKREGGRKEERDMEGGREERRKRGKGRTIHSQSPCLRTRRHSCLVGPSVN